MEVGDVLPWSSDANHMVGVYITDCGISVKDVMAYFVTRIPSEMLPFKCVVTCHSLITIRVNEPPFHKALLVHFRFRLILWGD